MNVLVIGSGGREHALAWAISRSPSAGNVYAAPGNPGTSDVAANVPLDPSDFPGILRFCKDSGVDLVVVGPENLLADGMADFLRGGGIAVFGPGREGAKLEASKGSAKEFMRRHGVPHASFRLFEDPGEAEEHVGSTAGPWVIKADGLALGKGVTITADRGEAREVIGGLMSGRVHGEAGRKIVIEEYLEGRELTAMALTDGETLFALPFSRDHKRVFDGNRGPMTGGMGAFSPVPLSLARSAVGAGGGAPRDVDRVIVEDVLERTLEGLKDEGVDFRGVIYAGLMLTEEGPKVLEYNVRFGDPEAQCVLPRLEGDFAGALVACACGRLAAFLDAGALRVKPEACISVVVASGGYPGPYRKGLPISGVAPLLSEEPAPCGAPREDGVIVFQAGTREDGGRIVTSGGRVLSVTALGPSLRAAAEKAYRAVGNIRFEGAHFRRDIAEEA